MSDATHIARLTDRIAVLEAENADLRAALRPARMLPRVLGLAPQSVRILVALARTGSATRRQLHTAMMADRPADDGPADKAVSVLMCRIRRVLRLHGITIVVVWGQGYRVPADDLARLRGLIAEASGPVPSPVTSALPAAGASTVAP
jgi:DNA-binding response OmpR family regulator